MLKFLKNTLAIGFILFFSTAVSAKATGWSGSASERRPETVVKRLRLGDRIYIYNVLLGIFGTAHSAELRTYILMQSGTFGGPCDPYEQVRTGKGTYDMADPESICPSGKFSANLPMLGSPNILRQSYTTHVCEILTSKNVSPVLKKIFTGENFKMPDAFSVQTAFRLFNPEQSLNENGLKSLLQIDASEKNVESRWSKILLTLCIDPQWQLI